MMNEHISRRIFLGQSVAGVSALGVSLWTIPTFADSSPILAKVAATPQDHMLRPALDIAQAGLKKLDEVEDYTATFLKTELVGRKVRESRMTLKLREEPFSVYLKFLNPSAGREVLYVRGANNNRILVKDVGFASLAGTVALDPTGSYAMDDNRYPLTDIGLRTLVTKLIETWLNEADLEGMTVTVKSDVPVDSLKCQLVEVTHSQRHAKAKFQTTRLYIDQATGLPVRLQAYDFPSSRRDATGALAEDYYYSNLQVNVGLAE
ncbi:MAG TPA: DUF1571 domain-containing protein, partial [Planctomicrobium sp.]|nr:DUF1571 domain-containing protein [Planctomicrobium sp.]